MRDDDGSPSDCRYKVLASGVQRAADARAAVRWSRKWEVVNLAITRGPVQPGCLVAKCWCCSEWQSPMGPSNCYIIAKKFDLFGAMTTHRHQVPTRPSCDGRAAEWKTLCTSHAPAGAGWCIIYFPWFHLLVASSRGHSSSHAKLILCAVFSGHIWPFANG